MSGTYALESTLLLSSSDSGTNGYTIRWTAAPGATPIFSGAHTIPGWSAAGGGQFKASVDSLGFRQLYVNGIKAARSQSPDAGWYQVVGASFTDKSVTIPAGAVGTLPGQSQREMVLETSWGESYLRVASIVTNGALATVTFNCAEANILFQRPNPYVFNGSPFRWQNQASFVTQRGEWCFDAASSTVYCVPRVGENMAIAAVTAPSLQTLVDISGASLNSSAKNISFSGITFTGTTWMMPTTSGYLNAQSALYNVSSNMQNEQYVGRPPAAVHVADADGIQFTGNRFEDVGSTAKNGGTNQQWRIVSAGGGLYQLINRNSGLSLGIAGDPYTRGARVAQETYTSNNDQLWYFEAGPSGSYVVRNFQSKKATEVDGASTSNGGGISQWVPLNSTNQQWPSVSEIPFESHGGLISTSHDIANFTQNTFSQLTIG